ncbi:hypothetical protein JY419_02655, partial [Stenotrophomonas maltophilia]|nr:hypothetical protein [Stenotrophomonas maltophilia]
MKMPELPIFARSLTIGFLVAEVWRAAFHLGASFAVTLSEVPIWAKVGVILAGSALCSIYAVKRGALAAAERMARSLRVDLLIAVGIGIWANELTSPWLARAHTALKDADPHWAPIVLVLLSAILLSPLIQRYFPRSTKAAPQLYFIADEEIGEERDDLLASEVQAKAFAETV